MCGIIGIAGKESVSSDIIKGLKKLELIYKQQIILIKKS